MILGNMFSIFDHQTKRLLLLAVVVSVCVGNSNK